MSKDTGGPAFPSLNAVCTGLDSDGFERWDTEPSGGMTLRDYFAAKAMQGIFASESHSDEVDEFYSCSDRWYESVARHAYQMADAMLKARAK